MKRIGTVVVFPEGMKPEKAEEILEHLRMKGVVDWHLGAEEYDDEWGEPVWYVP